MGKVTVREKSSVGESYSEIEYIFEDSVDWFAFNDMKQEALSKTLKSFSDSLLDTQDEAENDVTEIKVGKESPTKH